MIHTMAEHSAGFFMATITGGTFFAINVVSGETVIPIHEAASVMAIIIPVIWWFSRKFQKIDDNFIAINKRLDDLTRGDITE